MNVNATTTDPIKCDRSTKTILVTAPHETQDSPLMTIEEFINENRSLLT